MKYPFKFKWTKLLTQFCVENRIYLNHPIRTQGVYEETEQIIIQKPVLVERYGTLVKHSFFSVGAFSFANTSLPADIVIGRYCSLAARVSVMGARHPIERVISSPVTYLPRWSEFARSEFETVFDTVPYAELGAAPIIGNDVWIGSDVLLARDIEIGDGAVIAARSVVTKNVPPYAIVAGAPATIKRMRFSQVEIEALQKSKPWRFKYTDWPDRQLWESPTLFCEKLMVLEGTEKIMPWNPGSVDLGKEFYYLLTAV